MQLFCCIHIKMSKKSRLRAQKAKELIRKKEAEAYEQEEIRAARNGKRSRAAIKYEKKSLLREPIWKRIAKILMLVPFGVNGLFLGGITVIAILFLNLNMPDSKAYLIIAGDLLIATGIVLTFMRKYIIAFPFSAVGTGLFVSVGYSFVSKIQSFMKTTYVEPDKQNMDVKYMLYFYPMLILGVLALSLFIAELVKLIRKNKREKERFNNMPVKSIIDD